MLEKIKKLNKKYIIIISSIVLLLAVFLLIIHFHRKNTCSKNIAIIPITGELISSPRYNSDGTLEEGDTVSIDVVAQIRKADKDRKIKAIVFVIDSGGGDSASGEEIVTAIKQVKKPTVALIRSDGESAAYLIASATGRIFALNNSGTADIGVTMSYVDNSKKDKQDGLTFNQISYGKYKDMMNNDKPLTSDEKKLAMQEVNESANFFIQSVAENRHLPIEKVKALADGSVITGQDAIKIGLIDQIGSFTDVDKYLSKTLNKNIEMCITIRNESKN